MPVGVGLGVAGVAGAAASKSASKKAASASQSAAQTVSDSSLEAAQIQAQSQQEALEYLKQREALPNEIRDESLQGLSDFYRIPGKRGLGEIQAWLQANPNATDAEIALAMDRYGVSPRQIAAATNRPLAEIEQRYRAQGGTGFYEPRGQDQLIQDAMGSPLYAAIMGTQRAGEQTILRNASATGGLRSGNSNGALTDFGQQTANRALLESFYQAQGRDDYNVARSDRDRGLHLAGLTGLAGLQGNDQAIANLTSNIGTTSANGVMNAGNAAAGGILGSAQAMQQGTQNSINNVLGVAGLGLQAYGLGLI